MIQLSGIVGGTSKTQIAVTPGNYEPLQQIVFKVKKGQKLILKNLNFLLEEPSLVFRIQLFPVPGTYYEAKGGSGDVRPNKVLVHNTTGSDKTFILLITAVNTTQRTKYITRSDSWRLVLQRKSCNRPKRCNKR